MTDTVGTHVQEPSAPDPAPQSAPRQEPDHESSQESGKQTGPALGIDFGERRIGVALSDPAHRLALPLTTVERKNDRQARRALARLIEARGASLLVVGEPRRLDGTRGEAAHRVAAFARRLADDTGLGLHLVNESLTSVAAEERLRAAGVDPRHNREKVDAMAAQILLQEFLDRHCGDTMSDTPGDMPENTSGNTPSNSEPHSQVLQNSPPEKETR